VVAGYICDVNIANNMTRITTCIFILEAKWRPNSIMPDGDFGQKQHYYGHTQGVIDTQKKKMDFVNVFDISFDNFLSKMVAKKKGFTCITHRIYTKIGIPSQCSPSVTLSIIGTDTVTHGTCALCYDGCCGICSCPTYQYSRLPVVSYRSAAVKGVKRAENMFEWFT
jgi:hypothetical protein